MEKIKVDKRIEFLYRQYDEISEISFIGLPRFRKESIVEKLYNIKQEIKRFEKLKEDMQKFC